MGRVLFVACTNVGKAMIDTIKSSPSFSSEIVGIVNLNASRGMKKANYQTYADISGKYNIPLHYCDNVNDTASLEWIRDKQPDLIIQSGWSQKFREPLLHIPTYGCVGEHPAPIPIGRGAACVNWAILTGETHWGDTFFQMVEEYDRGAVYAQEFFEIKPYDTVKTVYDKVALCSKKIVTAYLDDWTEGRFTEIPLDERRATYYKRRTPDDGLFDFSMSAKRMHDFIRAQTFPYPGAFFMSGNNRKVTVLLSRESSRTGDDNAPGTIVGITENGGVLVAVGEGGVIELLRYRMDDGIECWFAENPRCVIGTLISDSFE